MASYTTFLNELQRFILQDSDALQLYRKYLSESPRATLVNHIDFYQDLLNMEKIINQTKAEQGDNPLSYFQIYTKYFSGTNPRHLLDLKQDILLEVRENVCKIMNSATFKPAIFAVVKDLCFENLTNFTNSDMFQQCKVFLRIPPNTSEMLNLPPKERDTTVRLRKFFGEQMQTKDAGRLTFRAQPRHVKSYRLNKRFGERVLLEHHENDKGYSSGGDSPRSPRNTEWKRSRRLHVFFGDSFIVDDILFSEKIRAPPVNDADPGNDEKSDMPKQPDHVNLHRLNRFFGERVHSDTPQRPEMGDSDDLDAEVLDTGEEEDLSSAVATKDSQDGEAPEFIASRFATNQRLIRFFGERIDPTKEATYKMFADQPANVNALKLKKIFGTPGAAAGVEPDDMPTSTSTDEEDDSGPSKKAKRAHKLHKFFGTKVEDDMTGLNLEDHVVPCV